ncbi:MAG: glutamine--fructose-6-phosphate transaminase (isomerizing), partial [Solirubrobacterales bacterium]|nr:glutamine--fructose-6-phosphate transaminase (isomerizing) [Solirubrobacterales bacterium]
MCGIIGYVGGRPAEEILVAGLEKLEYRGYDSAGMAILVPDNEVRNVRAVGNLSGLRGALEEADLAAAEGPDPDGNFTGIAHTRWATHGRVTEANAHPHDDESGKVQIVLNGIVENYVRLKEDLEQDGVIFTSETDAEVVAHLISRYFKGDLTEAVRRAYADLRGHYSIVAMHADAPGLLVGARKETPLIVGVGEGENFIASAIPAFLNETRLVLSIDNGEIVTIRPDGVTITKADGEAVERETEEVDWDEEQAEKAGYDTFMMKEIHEQPEAIAETILDRLTEDDSVDLSDIGFGDEVFRNASRIVIVACGTSYHAGLVGRYAIERWARVPVEMDIASEYRYRDPVINENDLVIGITQSGETADT